MYTYYVLSLHIFEPSLEDQEEFPRGSPPPPPDSDPESDVIEEVPEEAQDSAIVVPALIEPCVHDLAPVLAREAIHLRAHPTRSTSSIGLRALIGETNMVPHRLYTVLIRECHFLHGQNHELRRMND